MAVYHIVVTATLPSRYTAMTIILTPVLGFLIPDSWLLKFFTFGSHASMCTILELRNQDIDAH